MAGNILIRSMDEFEQRFGPRPISLEALDELWQTPLFPLEFPAEEAMRKRVEEPNQHAPHFFGRAQHNAEIGDPVLVDLRGAQIFASGAHIGEVTSADISLGTPSRTEEAAMPETPARSYPNPYRRGSTIGDRPVDCQSPSSVPLGLSIEDLDFLIRRHEAAVHARSTDEQLGAKADGFDEGYQSGMHLGRLQGTRAEHGRIERTYGSIVHHLHVIARKARALKTHEEKDSALVGIEHLLALLIESFNFNAPNRGGEGTEGPPPIRLADLLEEDETLSSIPLPRDPLGDPLHLEDVYRAIGLLQKLTGVTPEQAEEPMS